MEKFEFINTNIPDLLIISPNVHSDHRGFFFESYNQREFERLGLKESFVQDNHCKSSKGVLRGLHIQTKYCQGKLLRAIKGSIFEVAVDLRKDSPAYSKWFGIVLDACNKKQLYVPPGFANGYLTLEEDTEVVYKTTDYWHPEYEKGLAWNDEQIKVAWPLQEYGISNVILSDKDKKLPTIDQLEFEND